MKNDFRLVRKRSTEKARKLFLFIFCGARLKKYAFVSKYIKLLLTRTDIASDVFVAKGNLKRKKEFPN